MKILPNATEEQNRVINTLIDYMIQVAKVQGRLLDSKSLYGDGSRWLPLHREGFEKIYNEVYTTLK